MNEVLKTIYNRKSTKDYSGVKVSRNDLLSILNAGMTAPVGMKRYDTLHLTVVEDEALLTAISDRADMKTPARPRAPLYGAPTLIFVSAKFEREDNIEYANVGCIMENMAVAATALGVDSVYLWGFIRVVRANADLLAALRLPEGFIPVSALAVGYGTATDDAEETGPRHTVEINYV